MAATPVTGDRGDAATPSGTVPGRASDALRPYLIGIALGIVGVLAFSLRPILIKRAYRIATDPVTILALRMSFALPFFLVVAFWTRRDALGGRLAPRDAGAMALLGLLGFYLASFLDFLGLQYVGAGLGRILLFVYPTIVVVLSALFLRIKVQPRDIGALVLTYAGVALVLSSAIEGPSSDLPLGAALVFAGAAVFAIYLVAATPMVHRFGSVRFSAYCLSAASLAAIVQFLALRPLAALDLPREVYLITLVMALVATVMPAFATAEALRRIGANRVAMLGSLGPVITISLGYVGLDEVMTLPQLLGGVLVLAGVLLVSVKR